MMEELDEQLDRALGMRWLRPGRRVAPVDLEGGESRCREKMNAYDPILHIYAGCQPICGVPSTLPSA